MGSRTFRLAIFFCVFLTVAPAQVTQTPVITSLQSSRPDSQVPDHGNAITSGAGLDFFYLYINGSFDTEFFDNVRWTNTSTGETIVCSFDTVCEPDLSRNLIRIQIPNFLFSASVSSQVTINVTVTERFDANTTTSNIANFFINPPVTVIALPDAFRGVPYAQPFITGGTAPFEVYTGDLPAGLAVQPNDPTLRGTPTAAGTYDIYFEVNDAWGDYVEDSSSLRVLDQPTITGLTPPSRPAGGGNFLLTVTGTSFEPPNPDSSGSRIVFGGSTLTTTFISSTSLQATVSGALVAVPSTIPVLVRTPFTGDSNTVGFVVLPSTTVLSLNPSSVVAGGQAFSLTVTVHGNCSPTMPRA